MGLNAARGCHRYVADARYNPHTIESFGRSLNSYVMHYYTIDYGLVTRSPNPWGSGSSACRSRSVSPILRARWELHDARLPRTPGVRPDKTSETPKISCECISDYDGIVRLQPRQRRRGSPEGTCCGCGSRAAAGSGVPRTSHTIRPGPPNHLRRTQVARLGTPLKRAAGEPAGARVRWRNAVSAAAKGVDARPARG